MPAVSLSSRSHARRVPPPRIRRNPAPKDLMLGDDSETRILTSSSWSDGRAQEPRWSVARLGSTASAHLKYVSIRRYNHSDGKKSQSALTDRSEFISPEKNKGLLACSAGCAEPARQRFPMPCFHRRIRSKTRFDGSFWQKFGRAKYVARAIRFEGSIAPKGGPPGSVADVANSTPNATNLK
jgi:hypothetical protein